MRDKIFNEHPLLRKQPILWMTEMHLTFRYFIIWIIIVTLFSLTFILNEDVYFLDRSIKLFPGFMTMIFLSLLILQAIKKSSRTFQGNGFSQSIIHYIGIILPFLCLFIVPFIFPVIVINKIDTIIPKSYVDHLESNLYKNFDTPEGINAAWNNDTLVHLRNKFSNIVIDTTYYDYEKPNYIISMRFEHGKLSFKEDAWNSLTKIVKRDSLFNTLSLKLYEFLLIPLIFAISNILFLYNYEKIKKVNTVMYHILFFVLFNIILLFINLLVISTEIVFFSYFALLFFMFLIYIYYTLVVNKYHSFFNYISILFFIAYPFIIQVLTIFASDVAIISENKNYILCALYILLPLSGIYRFSTLFFQPKPL